jgi:hypothetical protein
MRADALFALALGCVLAAIPASAADNLDLARRLVHYAGGVSVILRSLEAELSKTAAAPDIFRQSFDQAMADNQSMIVTADDQLARTYAGLYSNQQLSAEVGFYESPEGRSIVARNSTSSGAVVWPDPGSMNLSADESEALKKFNVAVQNRAAVAAKSPKAMDQVLSVEAGAVIKVRAAAFANYCKIRDCKAEGVTLPPQ